MKKHTLLLACAMRILLNLIALPHRARGPRLRRSGTAVKSKNEADAFRVCLILFHSFRKALMKSLSD